MVLDKDNDIVSMIDRGIAEGGGEGGDGEITGLCGGGGRVVGGVRERGREAREGGGIRAGGDLRLCRIFHEKYWSWKSYTVFSRRLLG